MIETFIFRKLISRHQKKIVLPTEVGCRTLKTRWIQTATSRPPATIWHQNHPLLPDRRQRRRPMDTITVINNIWTAIKEDVVFFGLARPARKRMSLSIAVKPPQ